MLVMGGCSGLSEPPPTHGSDENRFAECADSEIVLMPHHLVARGYFEDMYAALDPWERVVVVSPDHFNFGSDWVSRPDPLEHGYGIHEDFIETYWPEVEPEGWMVKVGTPDEARAALVEELVAHLDEGNTRVIFSIDFSHYLPGEISYVHDVRSRDVIEARAIEDALTLEVDSPESVEIMLKVAEARGLTLDILANTNPSLDSGIVTFENTSHLWGCSREGEPAERALRTHMDFAYNREWYEGKTGEDRYLYGYDEMTFGSGEAVDRATVEYSDGTSETFEFMFW